MGVEVLMMRTAYTPAKIDPKDPQVACGSALALNIFRRHFLLNTGGVGRIRDNMSALVALGSYAINVLVLINLVNRETEIS